MNLVVVKTVLVAAFSAGLGYLTYTRTDLTAGITATFMAAWILFQFRGFEKAWTSLGNFQNPILFGINASFVTYIYLKLNQVPGAKAFYFSLAAFLLGGALSLLITKYWNIGP